MRKLFRDTTKRIFAVVDAYLNAWWILFKIFCDGKKNLNT